MQKWIKKIQKKRMEKYRRVFSEIDRAMQLIIWLRSFPKNTDESLVTNEMTELRRLLEIIAKEVEFKKPEKVSQVNKVNTYPKGRCQKCGISIEGAFLFLRAVSSSEHCDVCFRKYSQLHTSTSLNVSTGF